MTQRHGQGPRAALALPQPGQQRHGDQGDWDTRPADCHRGDTALSPSGSACQGWQLLNNNSNAVILLSTPVPLRTSVARMKTPR